MGAEPLPERGPDYRCPPCRNGRHRACIPEGCTCTEGARCGPGAEPSRHPKLAAVPTGPSRNVAPAENAGPKQAGQPRRCARGQSAAVSGLGAILLTALAEHGEVTDDSGRAATELARRCDPGADASQRWYTRPLSVLNGLGLIERTTKGRRTYRIAITEAGAKALTSAGEREGDGAPANTEGTPTRSAASGGTSASKATRPRRRPDRSDTSARRTPGSADTTGSGPGGSVWVEVSARVPAEQAAVIEAVAFIEGVETDDVIAAAVSGLAEDAGADPRIGAVASVLAERR